MQLGGKASILVAAIALASSGLVGCGDTSSSGNSEAISEADFGNEWPFSVDEGVLRCEGAGAVVFEAEGTDYAVNGTASGQGYAEIEPIWLEDPAAAGLKINIGPIIERGLALCE